jgi:hypothetical protein
MKCLLNQPNTLPGVALEKARRFLKDDYFSNFVVHPTSILELTELSLDRIGGFKEEDGGVNIIRPLVMPLIDYARNRPSYLVDLDFKINMPESRLTDLAGLMKTEEPCLGAQIIFNALIGDLVVGVDNLVSKGKWNPEWGNYAKIKRAYTLLQAEVEQNVRRLIR